MEIHFRDRNELREWLDKNGVDTRPGRIARIVEAARLNRKSGMM